MQTGTAVTGFDRCLYIWEVMGEDGTPRLDAPRSRWVPRDEKRIAQLIREGEKFMQWRADGAPIADADLPDEVDEALAIIAEADDAIAPHKKVREAALKIARAHAEAAADEHGSFAAHTPTRRPRSRCSTRRRGPSPSLRPTRSGSPDRPL